MENVITITVLISGFYILILSIKLEAENVASYFLFKLFQFILGIALIFNCIELVSFI